MDVGYAALKPSRFRSANIFSKVFFYWAWYMFRLGNTGSITPEEFENVPPDLTSEYLVDSLERKWNKELYAQKTDGTKPSMRRALSKTFLPQMILFNIIGFFEEALKLLQPIVLGLLINYFEVDSSATLSQGLLYAGILSLITVILNIIHEPYFFYNQVFGMKIRIACCGIMYKKALKLSNAALSKTSAGQINNLMTNDVNRFDIMAMVFPYIWLGPIDSVIALFIMVYYVGMKWKYVLIGYSILMLCLLPMQTCLGTIFGFYRKKTATITDKRITIMSEVLAAMRVIKMYAWEKPFARMVKQVRRSEISAIMFASILKCLNLAIAYAGNRLLEVIFLTIYFLTTEDFSSSTVFVISSLMSAIRTPLLRSMPQAIQLISECLVGCNRIEEFMLLEEQNTSISGLEFQHVYEATEPGITVTNLSGTWDDTFLLYDNDHFKPSSCTKGTVTLLNGDTHMFTERFDSPVIDGISVTVCEGEMLAIIGPVGSGKSTLLLALLQELPFMSGQIHLRGSIAYVSQKACIFPGTIRQNILFGKKFDEDYYQTIIEVAALSRDFEILPKGDMTMIGERGVTLSGGQQARVNLARALYKDADIYVLDDPLSAVDTKVGKQIFEKCIMEYLHKKPRILITHQLQYLHDADRILLLKNGKIERIGTYDDVKNSDDFIASVTSDEEDEKMKRQSDSEEDISMFMKLSNNPSATGTVNEKTPLAGIKGMADEKGQQGHVSCQVYKRFFRAGGGYLLLFILLFFIVVTQIIYVMADFWVSHWANQEECRTLNVTCPDDVFGDPYRYIDLSNKQSAYVFIGLIGVNTLFAVLRAVIFFYVVLTATKNLHGYMFDSVIRTPILFFDVNPVGRILNRFTKDMGIMDDTLPAMFFDALQILFLASSIILVNCILNWYLIFITLPLCLLYFLVRHYGIPTLHDIKRWEGILRSPVFAQVTQTMDGLITLRSYKMQPQFLKNFYLVQDRHSEVWLLYLAASRACAVWVYIIINIFMTFTSFGSIFARDSLNAGLVGIILSRTLLLCQIFQYVFFLTNYVENLMTSVERVLEYTKLKPEAPLRILATKPPSSWPGDGGVSFKHVSLSYSPNGPNVLKNMTLEIFPKEKIGVVGRTGAGKSSLITALFRLAEPKGTITIDGIDISTIGLHELRKKISIIPQDPVLFSTSLRLNLDPLGEYQDFEIWHALESVTLNLFVRGSTGQLEMDVGEGGANFSVGQRQLICLARAILRQNRVLILDEATANVDQYTDTLIQEMIRKQFKSCTVLTVAHRLNTVMDADRIMVLDAGEVKEFDAPYTLLKKRKSFLGRLVKKLSYGERKRLVQVAKMHHDIKKNSLTKLM
ncbi:multidrug resistance-associated protein 4-like isoform X2 [Anneissia japonica]|uniref:multidrug resistance-associated protein 4-like isoform X2 n=1 Tax=Anneissia japonica TaxID=1529436 RepID=UPI0014256B0E|nr:multidrug resistance-associated protein 4-like isoform X2 [Anneissia japonica]